MARAGAGAGVSGAGAGAGARAGAGADLFINHLLTKIMNASIPFKIGECYFIRTVTYHLTGKVENVIGDFLVLKDAAWVADSGRFTQAINNGILNEVEPVNVLVYVNINSITDAFDWKHKLPSEQK